MDGMIDREIGLKREAAPLIRLGQRESGEKKMKGKKRRKGLWWGRKDTIFPNRWWAIQITGPSRPLKPMVYRELVGIKGCFFLDSCLVDLPPGEIFFGFSDEEMHYISNTSG